MLIKITRSFERTRQIADFVPIKAYCEATIEEDGFPPMEKIAADKQTLKDFEGIQRNMSEALDALVQQEVEKTLMGYRPACIGCGGKQIVGGTGINKEGMCQTCADKMRFEASDFRKENEKDAKNKLTK